MKAGIHVIYFTILRITQHCVLFYTHTFPPYKIVIFRTYHYHRLFVIFNPNSLSTVSYNAVLNRSAI